MNVGAEDRGDMESMISMENAGRDGVHTHGGKKKETKENGGKKKQW